jgi:hypothetical protein
MTLQEVCKYLGKSESTLVNSFYRTQENLKKKGIILLKEGYGKKANYTIIYEGDKKNGEIDS